MSEDESIPEVFDEITNELISAGTEPVSARVFANTVTPRTSRGKFPRGVWTQIHNGGCRFQGSLKHPRSRNLRYQNMTAGSNPWGLIRRKDK